jgi:hypothetical protein
LIAAYSLYGDGWIEYGVTYTDDPIITTSHSLRVLPLAARAARHPEPGRPGGTPRSGSRPAAGILPAGLASRCRAGEAGDGSRWRGEPQARPGGALAIGGGAGRVGRPQHQREGGQVARHEVGRRGRWKRPFVFPILILRWRQGRNRLPGAADRRYTSVRTGLQPDHLGNVGNYNCLEGACHARYSNLRLWQSD